MAKKFEKTMDRVSRFEEELKMGCTTTRGVVRPLTNEEISYRKGFIETVQAAVNVKAGSQMGLVDPLYENELAGRISACAFMRGEKKHKKNAKDKRDYEKLHKRFGNKGKNQQNQKRK
jgi:hypothetical protein